LGWAAAAMLCAFNAFSFFMMIADYTFDFKDYLLKKI
jgi:hypothetical protein